MSEAIPQILIDAAKAYEALFIPALFGQWATKVADAAQIGPGQRVLDVACGTGILGREVASRVGPSGHVAGVDPNQGMVAVAKQLAPGLEWREATAEALPFPDQTFDAVVSQFGLMFFHDPVQSLREMWRVLVPGGHLAVTVWNTIDHTPAYARSAALLERMAGQAAADAVRLTFALGHQDKLVSMFAEAGIMPVEVNTQRGTGRFPSLRAMVEADLRGWLPVMGIILNEAQIGGILAEAERQLGQYVTPTGQMVFETSAHIVTATKA